jgi:hypothetical protein
LVIAKRFAATTNTPSSAVMAMAANAPLPLLATTQLERQFRKLLTPDAKNHWAPRRRGNCLALSLE